MSNRYAVILCGGGGTRLWPLSRTQRPKQFLALNGDHTLLQQTAIRLSHEIVPSQIYTVTHEDYRFEVKGQLAELFPEAVNNVLAEPCSRDTLPAIALATYQIYQQDKNALIGVFASDHTIDNDTKFIAAWQTAEQSAEQDYLVLLGIKPHSPATGYGYIKPGEILQFDGKLSTCRVNRFVEKPNIGKAQQFIRDGYLWNSGMFVFKAERLVYLLEKYQPKIYELFWGKSSGKFAEAYSNLPLLSIDYGLAEPLAELSEKIAVVPVDMEWSDLGSWDSIYAGNDKDANKNVTHGAVVNVDTKTV